MEVMVGGKYRLGRKLGSGSYGDIYHGKSTKKLSLNACLIYYQYN